MEPSLENSPTRPARALNPRSLIVLLLLLGAAAFLANFVREFYPPEHWLFFIYARYWLYVALFGVACASAGQFALRRLLFAPPILSERLTLAFGLGVLIFFLGVFIGGILGLFGHVFFFAWPMLLIAVGGRELWQTLVHVRRRLRRFGSSLFLPHSLWNLAALALLLLGVVWAYLCIMVPLNIGADSHWYHLPIAERYAAAGRISRFDDGWYLGVYPQLASLLYTWAFQSPGVLTDHTALCAHIEFFLFLLTLVGIAPLTRRLLGGVRLPFAGALVFLFPGILLYDSSLITGADHILAFWAAPLALSLVRCGRDFDFRNATLATLILSGALLVKYQSIYYLAVAVPFMLALSIKTRRFSVVGVALLVGLAVTSPHWLKNLVFYGDPVYPMLYKHLKLRPFHEGAGELYRHAYWAPQFLLHGTPWEKVRDTLVSLVSFSFVPHDWDFHGQKPIFGSLFTLLLLTLPFVKASKRLWLLAAAVHVGVAMWFVTTHQDRFLQSLLPWMVACTAALLWLCWRRLPLARAGVLALVGTQLVWGSDVFFFRTHGMAGESPLKLAVDLIASGHQGRYNPDERFRIAGEIQDVGRKLPPSAIILLHFDMGLLGAAHPVVNDFPGWQGAVEYLNLDSPENTLNMWRSLKVSHIVWRAERGPRDADRLAREAVFARTVDRYTEKPEGIDSFTVAQVRTTPADGAPDPTRILWAGCGDERAPGIYTPEGLAKNEPLQALPSLGAVSGGELEAQVAQANAALVKPACNNMPSVNDFVHSHFRAAGSAADARIYVR